MKVRVVDALPFFSRPGWLLGAATADHVRPMATRSRSLSAGAREGKACAVAAKHWGDVDWGRREKRLPVRSMLRCRRARSGRGGTGRKDKQLVKSKQLGHYLISIHPRLQFVYRFARAPDSLDTLMGASGEGRTITRCVLVPRSAKQWCAARG